MQHVRSLLQRGIGRIVLRSKVRRDTGPEAREHALRSACSPHFQGASIGLRQAAGRENETARGTQRPAGSALSWDGSGKGATPDCDRIAHAKWSSEVTVTLSAPLRIAEGTCTAARSAALAHFACGGHGASANGREFASWRTVVSGYPH